jgi:hypothetical protein
VLQSSINEVLKTHTQSLIEFPCVVNGHAAPALNNVVVVLDSKSLVPKLFHRASLNQTQTGELGFVGRVLERSFYHFQSLEHDLNVHERVHFIQVLFYPLTFLGKLAVLIWLHNPSHSVAQGLHKTVVTGLDGVLALFEGVLSQFQS